MLSYRDQKESIHRRLSRNRDLFSSEGGEKVDNYELSQFFSLAETRALYQQSQGPVLLITSDEKAINKNWVIRTATKRTETSR